MVCGIAGAIAALPAGDVSLDADDRLDPGLARLLIELHGPEQHAMVGERERRHLQLRRARDHARDRAGAVQQRIIAMVVEVYEVGMLHGLEPALTAALGSAESGRRG